MNPVPNLLTVDLDDRHVAAPAELESMVDGLLDALAGTSTRATFFASRLVANANPHLLNRLAGAGHEVACLTMTSVASRTPYCASFRDDLQTTKMAIEGATSTRVRGHRAVGFGVDGTSEWVYDVLVDGGFEYDSSRFPTRHTDYGHTPVPSTVHALQRWGGMLLEVPASTADIFAVRVQLGTTGSVRGLPLIMWKRLLQERQARGEPVVLHIRADELRRRELLPFIRTDRRNGQADRRTLNQMSGILGAFQFTSVANALPDLLRSAPIIES